MANQVVIGVKDKATADKLEQALVAQRVTVRRYGRQQALQFGMRLGPLEGSPQEFLELVQAAPSVVDAVFDTVERLRERIALFVDREPIPATREGLKTSFKKPRAFDRFEP